jgi:hypothetical protein
LIITFTSPVFFKTTLSSPHFRNLKYVKKVEMNAVGSSKEYLINRKVKGRKMWFSSMKGAYM